MTPPRPDPAEIIGQVAAANWRHLLRIHRYRLRPADLEDCLGQTILELLSAAARGAQFADTDAVLAAIARRFESRIIDRQRALAGRSPITAATARGTPLENTDDRVVADASRDPVAQAIAREQLAALAAAIATLTDDQRLVIVHQLDGTEPPSVFCARHGWSIAKYRKTAQRARARLRGLLG
jgi:DNA-directed RNA polymerase specialized sigma24 family protein